MCVGSPCFVEGAVVADNCYQRQRLERSSALEPFIGNQSTSTQSVQSESEDAEHTGAKKRFDAVRNQWL